VHFSLRTALLLSCARTLKISLVENIQGKQQCVPFGYGATVLITLNTPREKFWGAVLDITPAGISVRGVDLNSFDEIASMLRADEPVMASTVFFPLNRVERIELDVANGSIPSLSERFIAKSGRPVDEFLGVTDVEEHG
jgi:hypothetical protein